MGKSRDKRETGGSIWLDAVEEQLKENEEWSVKDTFFVVMKCS